MPTVYNPTDDLVGPIASALLSVGQTQLTGIDYFYADESDEPPQHNSLMVMSPQFDILDDTNGRLEMVLKFRVCLRYNVRQISVDNPALRTYMTPMLQAYSSWANTDLGGLSRQIDVKGGGIIREMYAGEMFRTLLLNLGVVTEYNIPVS